MTLWKLSANYLSAFHVAISMTGTFEHFLSQWTAQSSPHYTKLFLCSLCFRMKILCFLQVLQKCRVTAKLNLRYFKEGTVEGQMQLKSMFLKDIMIIVAIRSNSWIEKDVEGTTLLCS